MLYFLLKVLSYWNLNIRESIQNQNKDILKVLSYWNLNKEGIIVGLHNVGLKYYHIGI